MDIRNGPFVYRLGRQVFILVRGVRFPYGLQLKRSLVQDLCKGFFCYKRVEMEKVYVYVLSSEATGLLYVGMTKDVDNRLREHNAGKSKFTKGHRPWKLIYTELHENYESGRKREKYLKSAAGKRWLKKQDLKDKI